MSELGEWARAEVERAPSIIADVRAMIQLMQADRAYGPYVIHVHPSAVGLVVSTDRRRMRRRARRMGVTFSVVPGTKPRVYVLEGVR